MSKVTIESEEQSAPHGCRQVAEHIAELEKDPKKKAALDAARQRIKEHRFGDEQQPTFPTQPVWNPPLQLNGGYQDGKVVIFAAVSSVGKSFFSVDRTIENLTSF